MTEYSFVLLHVSDAPVIYFVWVLLRGRSLQKLHSHYKAHSGLGWNHRVELHLKFEEMWVSCSPVSMSPIELLAMNWGLVVNCLLERGSELYTEMDPDIRSALIRCAKSINWTWCSIDVIPLHSTSTIYMKRERLWGASLWYKLILVRPRSSGRFR